MRGAEFLPLALMGSVTVDGFSVEACPTSHDAAEPVALAIRTAAGHRVSVAYDLGRPTTAVRFLLRGSHAVILEANHDDVLLRTSGYPPVVQERIAGSGGHLSNRAAAELLAELLHDDLHSVVLAHLSERCNSEAEARAAWWNRCCDALGRAPRLLTWPGRTRRCRPSCCPPRSWACGCSAPALIPAGKKRAPCASFVEWVTTACPSCGGTGMLSGRAVGGPTLVRLTGLVRSPPDSVRRVPFTCSRYVTHSPPRASMMLSGLSRQRTVSVP